MKFNTLSCNEFGVIGDCEGNVLARVILELMPDLVETGNINNIKTKSTYFIKFLLGGDISTNDIP